jgi:hypothetical protein
VPTGVEGRLEVDSFYSGVPDAEFHYAPDFTFIHASLDRRDENYRAADGGEPVKGTERSPSGSASFASRYDSREFSF